MHWSYCSLALSHRYLVLIGDLRVDYSDYFGEINRVLIYSLFLYLSAAYIPDECPAAVVEIHIDL